MPRATICLGLMFVLTALAAGQEKPARDWNQWGGSSARNNVSPATGLPAEWNVGQFDKKTGQWQRTPEAKKVLWSVRLGSESYGSPVVVGDKVFCATNNGGGYLARYPAKIDLGCLLCFSRADGKFLWQYSAEKLPRGQDVDYPKQGICCSPLVEGNRLWMVTNRCEVVCLDTEGFLDGENDGPMTYETATAKDEADVVWSFDMIKHLGVMPRYMANCSVTAMGDWLLVSTSNGVSPSGKPPAPKAPSFIALDKRSGKLLWSDDSPGENILDGQWSSPAFAVLGGVPQAVFCGGDGWTYGFEATSDGKLIPRWKFDCNPKNAPWQEGGHGRKNSIIATPVIADGRVHVVTGNDPESGEGEADLWCIDPTLRGDASAELVFDKQGKPVPPRRELAADTKAGDQIKPNPNSAVVWRYRGAGGSGEDKDFAQVMHRSLGMPAIHDGLLVIGDHSGLVHCLDAKSGKPLWTHDMLSAIWGSPLIADGKVYLGTEDGDMVVFALGPQLKVLAKNPMGDAIYGSAVAAGGVLYINTRSHLFAIREVP